MRRIHATSNGSWKHLEEYWNLVCPMKYMGRLVPFTKVSGGRLKEVTLKGTLKERNGFIYLEVPNGIVNAIMKMIADKEVVNPKEATDPSKYIGAHISIISPEEIRGKKIKEIGQEFEYFLDKMYSVNPDEWEEVSKVYFINVKSDGLERLREKYNLTAKLNGHEFHITVGCKLAK